MGWILDFTINLGKGVGVNEAGGVQSRASVPAETWLFSLQWNPLLSSGTVSSQPRNQGSNVCLQGC